MQSKTLLGYDTNAKTVKGKALGYATGILYLAPANQSGGINVCKFASKGCAASCLYSAGRGGFNSVKKARIRKTLEFKENPVAFVDLIKKDIIKLTKKADKEGMKFSVRLNGTSDIRWEDFKGSNGKNVFDEFPFIQFYGYTKDFIRMKKCLAGKIVSNLHLTFSRSESNHKQVEQVVKLGGNVAVVFSNKLPASYLGKKVVNGDESDLRFLDGQGVIVGLKAKGKGRKDTSGFVVESVEGGGE